MNNITGIKSLFDRMNEKFSIISNTIETPTNLKKRIEKEEMSLLKKLSSIVEDINEGLVFAIRSGCGEYSVEIAKTNEDGTEVENSSDLVSAIKNLYISKGYKVNVIITDIHDVYNGYEGSYYNVTISF